MVTYLKSTRIADKSKVSLIVDVERFAGAQAKTGLNPSEMSKRDKQMLFSHFIYWGSFVVSGAARCVHPSFLVATSKEARNAEKQQELEKKTDPFHIDPLDRLKVSPFPPTHTLSQSLIRTHSH